MVCAGTFAQMRRPRGLWAPLTSSRPSQSGSKTLPVSKRLAAKKRLNDGTPEVVIRVVSSGSNNLSGDTAAHRGYFKRQAAGARDRLRRAGRRYRWRQSSHRGLGPRSGRAYLPKLLPAQQTLQVVHKILFCMPDHPHRTLHLWRSAACCALHDGSAVVLSVNLRREGPREVKKRSFQACYGP